MPKFTEIEEQKRIEAILPFGTKFTAGFGQFNALLYCEETGEYLTLELLGKYGLECLPQDVLTYLTPDEIFITLEPHHTFDNIDELIGEGIA
jgi:hypothetical protein